MGALAQFDGTEQLDVKTVYYSGTDLLGDGYIFCYDVAATVANVDVKSRLFNAVVKPATANLMAFAGVIAPQSIGLTGPCFIDIIPHQKNKGVVRALTNVNATAFSSALGPINNSYAFGTFADSTLNVGFAALAAETFDSSGTAAVKAIFFK